MPIDPNEPRVDIKSFRPSEIIVSEGAPSDSFYVILQGEVEILQKGTGIRVLAEGDVFGLEYHYLKRPYTTTAKAVSPSRIAAYSMDTIRSIIYDRPQLTEQILFSVLRQLEQTTQITEEHRKFDHTADIHERIYHDGERIYVQGSSADVFYRLVETHGHLSIVQDDRIAGTIHKPGELFGVTCTLTQGRRRETVISVGKNILNAYAPDDLASLAASEPLITLALINHLTDMLRDKR